jgi:polyribonucleotide nucleotidyltransferase
MAHIVKTITLPNGKEIHIETGRLARQADGAVVVRCGDTMLLATVVSSKETKDVDFLPLTVEYSEKFAAAGKIPGGFFKREGRLGESEILVSRLIDRALRPLFPDNYHAEVQVMVQLISADKEEQADALACFAASAAIMVSDIPFPDAVSEVRVGLKDGQFIINPSLKEMEGLEMDIIVACTNDSIMMVEGEMREVSEEILLKGMIAGHESCRQLNAVQDQLRAELGLTIRTYADYDPTPEFVEKASGLARDGVRAVVDSIAPKQERSAGLDAVKKAMIESLSEGITDKDELAKIKAHAAIVFKEVQKEVIRGKALKERIRLDGRGLADIRAIWGEVSYLPRAHGSALFTRGETQSLCTATLGTKLDEQTIDRVTQEGKKRFILHYNFPPFSTGESKPLRGPGRREVGHGNLAERALKMMMPDSYEYTVRVVSDILESNGSSSMASVCGGTMCLMDAGVPLIRPVSGIAMGLITDKKTGEFAVLSDILGDEDFIGDMDFKVAGTTKGLTACQMDIKVRGLSYDIVRTALEQSKAGRAHILDEMMKVISETRTELSPYAPRIEIIEIPSDMIGAVIGPGGKIIQEMQRVTGTTINIEEANNKGIVTIYSSELKNLEAARKMIKNIVAEPEIGEVYMSKVKSIKDFGAFVEYMPGKEGLLHISEISYDRLETMDGVLEVGQDIEVKLVGVDEKSGKVRLSHKALLPKPEGYVERPERGERGDRGDRGDRGGDRGGRRDDRRGGGGGGGDRRGGGGGGGRY